jgi:hypothetical protein
MPDSALSLVLSFIPAAAGLGTAAMGIVDSSKAYPGGGPSLFGFNFIESGLTPFLAAPTPVPATGAAGANPIADTAAPPPHVVFGEKQVIRTLKSNWINGVNKPDQKAVAKALIHMELTQHSAAAYAAATGVNAALLQSLAEKVAAGDQPTTEEVTVLGQFDVVLSAILDDAYERGDQMYRNACKALAMGVAVILAVIASRLLGDDSDWFSKHTATAVLVGLSAAPLAPIAKDLATSIQSAASALGFIKG